MLLRLLDCMRHGALDDLVHLGWSHAPGRAKQKSDRRNDQAEEGIQLASCLRYEQLAHGLRNLGCIGLKLVSNLVQAATSFNTPCDDLRDQCERLWRIIRSSDDT